MRTKSFWKKTWFVVVHIFQIVGIMITVALSWMAANFLTKAIYTIYSQPTSHYLVQIIDAVLGVIIFIVVVFVIGIFLRPRQLALMTAIIDAMRRISKGDFKVKLEMTEQRGEFQKIIQSINEMAQDLGQLESMRQDFISNVSHEIQSPLTSIRGFARALRNRDLSEDKREHYLDIIEGESRRLSQMSDNLLKLSSLESDKPSFETHCYRLDHQLQNVVLANEPQWLAKGIQVDLNLQEIEIKAAEDLLNQVWVNLLHNSIKFTPDAGAISIRLIATENGAEVTIEDTGIGIASEDLVHIFERFYKADKSRNREAGGSGLGLSIVKKIIDIHQGDISAQSQIGQGTRFVVTVPYSFE
ncbi:sensor histidine kinase [Paenibacillus segetis]|uniref:Heme sensor protein HssS n=1 Tax=Paenibacillus segetis TaxID=1325360 RepID=A0ABQ1YCG0_9BACL|nr:HAMP domain-containing sensor histidine kinase [Paenibacillus segetis]GGH19211.1 two-component sensor histidine kinase [Paenibacillus segetis]